MVPPGRDGRAADLVRATVWTAPPLGAAIASLWVGDGTAALLEAEKRREARMRQDLAAKLLPAPRSRHAHPASMHLWLGLRPGRRAQEMVERAAAADVRITPGSAFGIGSAPNAVRLALGAPSSRDDLKRALALLAAAW